MERRNQCDSCEYLWVHYGWSNPYEVEDDCSAKPSRSMYVENGKADAPCAGYELRQKSADKRELPVWCDPTLADSDLDNKDVDAVYDAMWNEDEESESEQVVAAADTRE